VSSHHYETAKSLVPDAGRVGKKNLQYNAQYTVDMYMYGFVVYPLYNAKYHTNLLSFDKVAQ